MIQSDLTLPIPPNQIFAIWAAAGLMDTLLRWKMNRGWFMATRRHFSREFKVEAVKLVTERGVSIAQAARDLDVHETMAGRG
jgi:hypothetical protein